MRTHACTQSKHTQEATGSVHYHSSLCFRLGPLTTLEADFFFFLEWLANKFLGSVCLFLLKLQAHVTVSSFDSSDQTL